MKAPQNSRSLRLRLALGLVSAVCAVAVGAAGAGAAAAVDVLESDDSGVTVAFRLDSYELSRVVSDGAEYVVLSAPGLLPFGEEGAPAAPAKAVVLAAPQGAAVRAVVRSEKVRLLEGIVPAPWPSEAIEREGDLLHPSASFRPDERYYSPGAVYPRSAVEVKELGNVRGLRLVALVFHPFRYDASRKAVEYRPEIVARVEFEGGKPGEGAPAPRGDKRWEPLLRAVVRNYEQARRWRAAPAPARARAMPRAGAVPRFKIKARESALYRVKYDDLATLAPVSPVDTSEVRLYESAYSGSLGATVETEIPVAVEDADADGSFGPGDSFVFYGLSYWDRFPAKSGKGARVRPHIYWLALGETGRRMEAVPAWGEFTQTATPRSFPESRRFEEDKVLDRAPHDEDTYLFWFHSMLADETFPVEVPSPDPDERYGVRVRFQPAENTSHRFGLFVSNGAAEDTVLVGGVFVSVSNMPDGKPPFTYFSGLSGERGFLASGANSVRITGERLSQGEWIAGLGAFMDWFEIEYSRLYEAWNDTLTCPAGPSAEPLEVRITGFSSPSILAFDVTDQLSPRAYELDSRNVSGAGDGTYTLAIRGDFARRGRIAAAESSAVRSVAVSDIEPDAPSDLRAEGEGADYIIVVYDEFAEEVEPLVALRESQGFAVAVAKASDVYDEFGDGYKSDEAIKNYFTYAYRNWGSAYALLVGDASEDTENVLTGPQGGPTPPDFVPTHLYLHTGVPNAPTGPEIVNTDAWYAVWLDGVKGDWVPDMFIGRLPAGSRSEARDMVDKIVRYERFGEDPWRSRGLLVADDAYSSSIFFNMRYCSQDGEKAVFEPVCDRISSELEDPDGGVPGFSAPVFKLDDYLGTFPDDPKKKCYDGFQLFDIQDYTRAHVTPVLVDTMSMGWLFVSYQGHGNENVWTHESLFTSYPEMGGLDDVSSLGNTDRPFILYAFSCHVADFDDRREGDAGDCMGERMLLLPEAGAAAVYASAGYEYLSTGWFNVPLIEALLMDPPVEEETGEAFIRLGPATAKGGILYLAGGPYQNRSALETFALLGDPAMRVDAAPPRITAAVGDTILLDGDSISDPSGAGELDVRYEIRDEVAVDSSSVFVREIWHRTEGQDSTYVVPPSEYQVSRSDDGRRYELAYTVRLLPASMELVAGAVDRNGRTSSLTLKAVLTVIWEADGNPLTQDEPVGPVADFEARVTSPVPVSEELLAVTVDGLRSSAFEKRRLDSAGMEWELSAEGLALADGRHELALLVDGRPVKSVRVRVDTRFRFASIVPYPNPCDEEGTTIFYELATTGETDVEEVTVKIYSVSGRLVAVLRDPAPGVGRGSLRWDATDDSGDAVGNGVYICKASAIGGNGRRATAIVKVAVAR